MYSWVMTGAVGDFTLGFYFYDFQAESASGMADDDGAYFSISY